MGEARLNRVVFREAQAVTTPFHKVDHGPNSMGAPTPASDAPDIRQGEVTPERVHDLTEGGGLRLTGTTTDLEAWQQGEFWGFFPQNNNRGRFARKYAPRWPHSQTSWFQHLTKVCSVFTDDYRPSKSKLRTVAKRLHIEQQAMDEAEPWQFTAKYWPIIPDLNMNGGLPDDRFHELPGILSGLVGRHLEPGTGTSARPTQKPAVRLYRFEEAEALGFTRAQIIQCARNLYGEDYDAIRVGHDEWRIEERLMDALREIRAAATN